MDQNQYAGQEMIVEPPHDVIQLPSEGKFYANKKASLKVAYLTAADENILTSPNLIQNGTVLEVLLGRKILDRDIKPDQLLAGDRNAVLFFLRSTGYGANYTVNLTDPKDGKLFKHTFNLEEIKSKELTVEPDAKGECTYTLPTTKKVVKFRYLTQSEEDKIIKEDEARRKKLGKNAISELLTKRLATQVVEIDNIRDKGQIQTYINELNVLDARALRSFIADNEPGLDLNFEVDAPSGEMFSTELPITPGFLWPDFGV